MSILKAQFLDPFITTSDEDIKPPAPRQYDITKRGEIVRLIYEPILNPTELEKHT